MRLIAADKISAARCADYERSDDHKIKKQSKKKSRTNSKKCRMSKIQICFRLSNASRNSLQSTLCRNDAMAIANSRAASTNFATDPQTAFHSQRDLATSLSITQLQNTLSQVCARLASGRAAKVAENDRFSRAYLQINHLNANAATMAKSGNAAASSAASFRGLNEPLETLLLQNNVFSSAAQGERKIDGRERVFNDANFRRPSSTFASARRIAQPANTRHPPAATSSASCSSRRRCRGRRSAASGASHKRREPLDFRVRRSSRFVALQVGRPAAIASLPLTLAAAAVAVSKPSVVATATSIAAAQQQHQQQQQLLAQHQQSAAAAAAAVAAAAAAQHSQPNGDGHAATLGASGVVSAPTHPTLVGGFGIAGAGSLAPSASVPLDPAPPRPAGIVNAGGAVGEVATPLSTAELFNSIMQVRIFAETTRRRQPLAFRKFSRPIVPNQQRCCVATSPQCATAARRQSQIRVSPAPPAPPPPTTPLTPHNRLRCSGRAARRLQPSDQRQARQQRRAAPSRPCSRRRTRRRRTSPIARCRRSLLSSQLR